MLETKILTSERAWNTFFKKYKSKGPSQQINSIENEKGETLTKWNEINQYIAKHFSDQLGADELNPSLDIESFALKYNFSIPKISENSKENIALDLNNESLRSSINYLSNTYAGGPDLITPL